MIMLLLVIAFSVALWLGRGLLRLVFRLLGWTVHLLVSAVMALFSRRPAAAHRSGPAPPKAPDVPPTSTGGFAAARLPSGLERPSDV